MASTDLSAHINGNYAPHGYENSYATGASNFTPSQQPTAQPAQQAPVAEVPKDEVGWYFVEQYYTTLSKSPERLYLFYNKRSQYVSGVEEEKVSVCVGQKAINERIKGLDFKDTKVRVTNVDTQGSESNIVIQVIGEISNQGQPHKRFAQTFVLAEQTNGYFVLNDIFRYLAEEPEEEEELQQGSANGVQEPAPTAAVPEDASLNHSSEVADREEDLTKVDEKLQAAQEEPAAEPVAAAAPAQQVPEEVEAPETEEAPAAVSEEAPKAAEAPVAEEAAQPKKPKAPVSTSAPSAARSSPVAMPAGPPKPAAPRTWASLAASAHKVATPVVAAPASQQAAAQPKAATATQPAAAAPSASQTSAPARDQSPPASQGEATGWQSVTGHKKEQSRAQNQGPAVDPDQKRAYIKNVYSQVEEGALRSALTKFGEIEYLDISRPKNCAFVDFKTPAAYQAAIAANPHTVDGIELKVEERRPRPEQFRGGFPRGGTPRGRGGVGGQGSRGGYQPRGRGGPARGGRGAPQEA
ncbi:hypothetical protein BDU57DRAFT_520676 [Ampelomyces quisqualis]|uniref:NTF2 and RRM domain-containing protein n=1 Tax=Ampelomyces quisqualis TaxID=50730 RepID=A0A6A5QED5_AMPQU|nr:hypothetical protein BDU57DRAFT_520676 [Ampelomyces quisqualis]